jgi:penicillin-binding protein 1A
MTDYIALANERYRRSSGARTTDATSLWTPMTELLTLVFDLPSLKMSDQRSRAQTNTTYMEQINPIIDVLSMMFNLEGLKVDMVGKANERIVAEANAGIVEGTLISIENDTGAITALVGGSEFTEGNQFIRAVQARLQPGSTFKPLFYSAAIDSRKFTTVTSLNDAPVVFYTEAGEPYIPENYGGLWRGPIQLYRALALSLNIPALEVLDGIGFDAAINRSVALLGISKEEQPTRAFDRVYPLALGSCSVRPVEMARAYAIFANGGREINPYAIRTVEDRNGRVFLNPEQENRGAIQRKGEAAQVISPQNAFIMTNLLQSSIRFGTLSGRTESGRIFTYKNSNGNTFIMPSAGKTGTTQNWGDAWTIGYTPYLTTAVWFGFDSKGRSLGRDQTGEGIAVPAWIDFMKVANEDYTYKDFPHPQSGLVLAEVCSVSGQLLTPECGNSRTTQYFLAGTQPQTLCTVHSAMSTARTTLLERLEEEHLRSGGEPFDSFNTAPLVLDLSFLDTPALLPKEPEDIEEILNENKGEETLDDDEPEVGSESESEYLDDVLD